MLSLDILYVLTASIILTILLWLKNNFTYWKREGIATASLASIWDTTVNFVLQRNSNAERYLNLYDEFKSRGLKHGGTFVLFSKFYIPIDLEIIKGILQTDFSHFVDRGMYVNEKIDPISAHLFSLEGKKWKLLRNKLSPTFTSGKMKMMFETLLRCTEGLYEVMDMNLGNDVEMGDITGRFTLDIIGNCAFGIECNSLRNPNNDFSKYSKRFFDFDFRQFCIIAIPDIVKMLNIKSVPGEVGDFFINLTKSTVDFREKNQIYRKDFMHLLIQLKNRGKIVDDEKLYDENITESENKITMDEIAAQSLIFFAAGYETSSTTMTFCLYELAKNKNIQKKVRDEIKNIFEKNGNKLTYESLMDMQYLDQTVNETLRKYPIVPNLSRICTKNYQVPGTDLILEKGTKLQIPIIGIHRDEDYYPDPEKFDPERFSEDNKRARPAFTYLPFGEGPRICIGLRFGVMQTKIGLIALLLNYDFEVGKKLKEPLTFDKRTEVLGAEGGMWLNYKKISQATVDLLPK